MIHYDPHFKVTLSPVPGALTGNSPGTHRECLCCHSWVALRTEQDGDHLCETCYGLLTSGEIYDGYRYAQSKGAV